MGLLRLAAIIFANYRIIKPIWGGGGEIHLALSEPNQIVSVQAGVPGMPPMVVETLQTPYGLGLVFEFDFPEGIDVKLSTSKPVTYGIWNVAE